MVLTLQGLRPRGDPGLDQLDGAPGFKLIVRKGDAALYDVTACS